MWFFLNSQSEMNIDRTTSRFVHKSSHTRMVVWECDEASQWKRPKFDPSPHQNPLTDLHKNWQTWLRPGRHPTCKILYRSIRVSAPQMRDFAVYLGWLVFLVFFWGFFSKATAYTLERIFTQNTSKEVAPGKEVPFGGPINCVWYLYP